MKFSVASADVDLGWANISGHKTEQLVQTGGRGSCVIWEYDLNCCVIQIIRYAHVVEWAALDRNTSEEMQVKRGVKLTAETSQLSIARAAAEAVFGNTQLMWRVLGVIEQMNEEHARNHGDMDMSLNGYFEPFPFERK
jgi:hypothetical protein